MTLLDAFSRWRDYKGKRRAIGRLLGELDVPLMFWRLGPGSPLRVGETTLRMPMDAIIGPRTLAWGHWHGEHTQLIEAKLAAAGDASYFLIDVGANIGLVTRQLLASSRVRWSGAACFEPEAGNLESLRWNIAPLHNAKAFGVPISDRNTKATLHVDLGNAGDCSLDELPQGTQRAGVARQEVTLVSGAAAYDLIRPLHGAGDRIVWKSDTQGHDPTIMAAMPEALWPRVAVAMVEVRCASVSDEALRRFLAIAAQFPHRSWIKRGEHPVTLDELKAFCQKRSSSELDLLLYR